MRMWQESYDGIGSQMPGVLFEQGEMAILFRRNCNTAKFRAIVCQKKIFQWHPRTTQLYSLKPY